MLVNAGPVPLQGIVSTCQSAKSALIFVRLLCVPPAAGPSGVVADRRTVTGALLTKLAWLVVLPMPWKFTVAPDA
jgi:hypothetical protein